MPTLLGHDPHSWGFARTLLVVPSLFALQQKGQPVWDNKFLEGLGLLSLGCAVRRKMLKIENRIGPISYDIGQSDPGDVTELFWAEIYQFQVEMKSIF